MNGMRRIKKRETCAEIRRGRPTSRAKKSRKYQTPAGIPEKAEVRPPGLINVPRYSITSGVSSATTIKITAITTNLRTTWRNIQETIVQSTPANGISGFQDDEERGEGKNRRHDEAEHAEMITNKLTVGINHECTAFPGKGTCGALGSMSR